MTKRKRHQKTSLGLHLQKGKTMLRHREHVSFCQPGRVVSSDINPADSMILDFFSERWEDEIILFKPSSLCYSAIAAPRENILQYTFTSPSFFFLFSFSFTYISCVTISVWGMCVCVCCCVCCSVESISLSLHELVGSSVYGTSPARKLEWVAMSSSRGSSWPRDQIHISCTSCLGRQILHHWATWEHLWCT